MSDQTTYYKNKDSDQIFWIDQNDYVGRFLFTFDKKKVYNLFVDYPMNMSDEEIRIFDNENPEWADFFKDRKKS